MRHLSIPSNFSSYLPVEFMDYRISYQEAGLNPMVSADISAENTNGFRFAFNGQERDDELNGVGNSYAFKYRIHDPRLGRFLSIDPMSHAISELSPYQFASNTPIMFIDIDGLQGVPSTRPNSRVLLELDGAYSGGFTYRGGNLQHNHVVVNWTSSRSFTYRSARGTLYEKSGYSQNRTFDLFLRSDGTFHVLPSARGSNQRGPNGREAARINHSEFVKDPSELIGTNPRANFAYRAAQLWLNSKTYEEHTITMVRPDKTIAYRDSRYVPGGSVKQWALVGLNLEWEELKAKTNVEHFNRLVDEHLINLNAERPDQDQVTRDLFLNDNFYLLDRNALQNIADFQTSQDMGKSPGQMYDELTTEFLSLGTTEASSNNNPESTTPNDATKVVIK